MIATCNKLFGIEDHLTNRDKWAGTFEHVFSESSAREDAPSRLIDLPDWTQDELAEQWAKPLNDHMEVQIQFYCKFNQRDPATCGKDISNQLEASLFLRQEAAHYLEKAAKGHFPSPAGGVNH